MFAPFSAGLWLIFATLIAACIGSFLTVVVFRYPHILYREWEEDYASLKKQQPSTKSRFNLAYPRSHCPTCQNQLKIWHNLPLVSFICLRGKCSFCKQPINRQYAIIEWLCTILTLLCVWYWGMGVNLITPLVTLYFFIPLAFIDYNEHLLPDTLTLGLMWLGLLANFDTDPANSIIGAAGGYAIPWLVNRVFICIRHKPGMGHGDFKCLAAVGAWAGFTAAMGCYVLAAILSLIVTLPLLMRQKLKFNSVLPFGPFICLSGWIWINFKLPLNQLLQKFLFG